MRRRVDYPDVALLIDAQGVCAARRASSGAVNGRVPRPVRRPVVLGNTGHLPLADHPVAPGTDELSAAVELQNRVRATMKDEYSPFGRHSDTRGLNEIP